MSELKNKSDFNNIASELLLKNRLYAPSVHCSYYRCIQYMLHIVFNKLKVDKAEFDAQMKQRKDGTHGHAIFTIGCELIKKNTDGYKDFQRLVPKLKEYRELSDYKDEVIGQTIGQDAKGKSDSIMNILVKNF